MSSRMTGDIKNNVRKLQLALRKVGFEKDIDLKSITSGEPQEHLRIYHHLLTEYSHGVARLVTDLGIELRGKTDLRFMEAVYRILRDLFSYQPPITRDQFFSSSFAERKVILSTELAEMVYRKHRSMPKPKSSQPSSAPSRGKVRLASDVAMRNFDKEAAQKHSSGLASTHGARAGVQRHAEGRTSSSSSRISPDNKPAKKPRSARTSPLNDVTNKYVTGRHDVSNMSSRDVSLVQHDVTDWSINQSTTDPVFINEPSRIAGVQEAVQYSFAEPIDIVASTPQSVPGSATSGRQRTSSPIEQRPELADTYTLTEEQIQCVIDERIREQLELILREKVMPEVETLRARTLILENKYSILQAEYDKLSAESGGEPARRVSTEPLLAQGHYTPTKVMTVDACTTEPATVHSRTLDSSDPIVTSDRDLVTSDQDMMTSEERLQNVVSSLVGDIVEQAKMDLSDDDLKSYGCAQAREERMLNMIQDINSHMKKEVV